MTPPIQPGAAPAVPDQACDLTPVDFTVLKSLPPLETLHPALRNNINVKIGYGILKTAQEIDTQIGQEQGTQNQSLESGEVDAFLKLNSPANSELAVDSCTFMAQFRSFIKQAPQFKAQLEAGPDLSPIPSSFFKELPYLREFSEVKQALLEKLGDEAATTQVLNNSRLPQALKDLFQKVPVLLTTYLAASDYALIADKMDGQISLEKVVARMAEDGLTPEEAQAYFFQMKIDSIPFADISLNLREELNLAPPQGFFSLKEILFLAETIPEFVQSYPELEHFLKSVFPKNSEGKTSDTAAVQDLIISFEEFKESPFIKNYLETQNVQFPFAFHDKKTPEDIFANFQAIRPSLSRAISLWPDALRGAFERMPKESRDKLQMFMNLSVEEQQLDFVIRMMESESFSKYVQERELDHPHEHKGFMLINGITWLFSGGETTYGNYFHNTRPQEHKDTRDRAIQSLRKIIQENNYQKIEDATSHLANHGQTEVLKILNEQCSLATWTATSKITVAVDRNKELVRLAQEYRVGKVGSIWDWQIIPTPSLGEGGFFERAFKADNWTWLNTPQIPMALALNSHVAYESANNYALKHFADFSILIDQMTPEQAQTFKSLLEKIHQGEEIAPPEFLSSNAQNMSTLPSAIEQAVNSDLLSPEAQEELLQFVKIEMVKVKNRATLKDEKYAAEFAKLDNTQQNEVLALMGNSEKDGIIPQLFADPLKPFDPARVKKAIESLESTFDQVVDVDISQEKQLVLSLQEKKLPDSFLRAMMKVVGEMKRVEGGTKPAVALETLFREAKFPNPSRARELFNQRTQSEEQLKEFRDLVRASHLSEANQERFLASLILQPNTFVAEEAEETYMDILGHPEPEPGSDPNNPVYSSRYTGNLHSAMRTTIHRGVFGAGLMAAPTLVSGSIGHAFFNSVKKYAQMPVDEITGLKRWVAGGRWLNRLGNNSLAQRVTANFAPKLGAAGFAFTGTLLVFASPYGDQLRDFSHEAWTYPYFPWSDAAVRDLPSESVHMYLGMAASFQGMESVLFAAKTLGALELGTRSMNVVRSFEIGNRLAKRLDKAWPWAANKLRSTTAQTLGLEGKGVFARMKIGFLGRTESQLAEAALKDPTMRSAWAADVPGLNTPERIWAKKAFEETMRKLNFHRGNMAQGRIAQIHDELAQAGLEASQRQALSTELQNVLATLSSAERQILVQTEMRARSLRVLGQVGPNPAFSRSILRQAQKWMDESLTQGGRAELAERAGILLEKGAEQFKGLAFLEFQNQKLAKFMLWMLFQQAVDEARAPKTPVVPTYPEVMAPGDIITPLEGKDLFPMSVSQ